MEQQKIAALHLHVPDRSREDVGRHEFLLQ
jgi:hypothetical protein